MFSDVRTYFNSIALGLNYVRHNDGFAFDNIPSTKLHRSFHVEAFNFNGIVQNQLDQEIEVTVVVRLFFKAYRNVDEGIAMATDAGEAYIEVALASENRLGPVIKNVLLESIVIEPYASSNDNAIVCVINFNVKLNKGIC